MRNVIPSTATSKTRQNLFLVALILWNRDEKKKDRTSPRCGGKVRVPCLALSRTQNVRGIMPALWSKRRTLNTKLCLNIALFWDPFFSCLYLDRNFTVQCFSSTFSSNRECCSQKSAQVCSQTEKPCAQGQCFKKMHQNLKPSLLTALTET